MKNDVYVPDGLADGFGGTNITLHKLDIGGPLIQIVQIENPDGMTLGSHSLDEQMTEVPGAPGYQSSRGSGCQMELPWSRHQRMLLRIPSSRATVGL